MGKPNLHEREAERLAMLHALHVLDTPHEEEFDALVRLASQICQTPMAFVTLIDEDRQWIKACVGLDVRETSRDIAFCAHAILEPGELVEVHDARADARFSDNPAVAVEGGVRFYAGAILRIEQLPLGTLCVVDIEPRVLDAQQRSALIALGRQASRLLGMRRTVAELASVSRQLSQARDTAERSSREKSSFLAYVAHELRTPLTAIVGFSELLTAQGDLSPRSADYASTLHTSSLVLVDLVNELLDLSKVEAGKLAIDLSPFAPAAVLRDTVQLMRVSALKKRLDVVLDIGADLPTLLRSDSRRFRQVITNLVGNAIKFTAQGVVSVEARWDAATERLTVDVTDSGIGIRAEDAERIFEPFEQADGSVSRVYGGTGLGLALSRSIARLLGGDVIVTPSASSGSCFRFTAHAPQARGTLDAEGVGRRH